MRRKKIKLVVAGLCVALSMSVLSTLNLKASNVLPYKQAYGQNCVNIIDLAESMGAEIQEDNGVYNIFLNGTGITIYPNHNFIYVNGNLTPLVTEKVTDSVTGLEFDFPIGQKPQKDESGKGFLIPATILEKSFGVKTTDKGIEIPKKEEVKPETPTEKPTEKPNNNNNNNTSKPTEKPNNNNNNNNNNTSKPTEKPNNGSSNSGSTNNKPTEKPNNNNNNNNNNTSKPTEKPSEPQKPVEKPTEPQKPVEKPSEPEKPVEKPTEPQKPAGLSPSAIASRLPGLGLSYSAEDSGYGIKVYNNSNMSVAINGNSSVNIQLFGNSASGMSVTKQILNLAMPTGGNEVYNAISKPFSGTKRMSKDGKTVEAYTDSMGVVVNIYY